MFLFSLWLERRAAVSSLRSRCIHSPAPSGDRFSKKCQLSKFHSFGQKRRFFLNLFQNRASAGMIFCTLFQLFHSFFFVRNLFSSRTWTNVASLMIPIIAFVKRTPRRSFLTIARSIRHHFDSLERCRRKRAPIDMSVHSWQINELAEKYGLHKKIHSTPESNHFISRILRT